MKTFLAKNVFLLRVMLMAIAFSPLACGDGCNKEQTRALWEIRNSTNGFAFAGWDGKDCCLALGIACDENRRVVSIVFGDAPSNITWYPNVTLFTLFDDLEELGLYKMQIGGGLEPYCQLKRLKHLSLLDLSGNILEGKIPFCLGMIENIQEIYLQDNRLRENLPPSIFSKHNKITIFHAGNNQLEGVLSSSTFADTSYLEYLLLSGNRYQGNLPPSIFSNQSKIKVLDVSDNKLEGVLSFSIFANASNLMYLDLSRNYDLEVETESPSWVPTFQLNFLALQNCNLNKKNGHVFPRFIFTQVLLKWLDLSHTSIEGSIPCKLLLTDSITTLILRSNKFYGSLSLDCFAFEASSLGSLDISDNNITGSLPENIGQLLPGLQHVNMSSNALEGIIPWSLGTVLLTILDLSNNMLSGTIPESLTDGTGLSFLNLSNNKLKGEMLPRDSNMTNLECLQLGGNQFEGMISPTISNSPNLVILDIRNNHLSGNIPKWLYDHPRLVAILLSGNRFESHLLRRMCQMESVQIFDISRNLVSGGIPSCLGNIKFWKKSSPSSTNSNHISENGEMFYLLRPFEFDIELEIKTFLLVKHVVYTFKGIPLSLMTIIDMSSNQLTGSIPLEMGELSQLRSLNLSNNFLTGPIPNSFQNLENVESLDLSNNRLSGGIPHELVGLTYLSTFSVAYNNLSGRVPFERQFSTFETQCYDGNPDLCGDPLPRNCSTTNPLEPGDENEKEETRIIDSPLFFYAFVTISYAFGFWVFFGILIIKKNWRQSYFRAVDKYIESCFQMLYKYR